MPDSNVNGIRVIGALTVKNGVAVSKSPGVDYKKETGIVSFPNPTNLSIVPVISDLADANPDNYMTETHFIRALSVQGKTNQFTVWRTPLDTTSRNSEPTNFTAIFVGI